MRTIKKIHSAHYSPIGDLLTHSPLPSRTLDQIDPFIFLNHHGPQQYPPNNHGLPFGPHPHRGMETVTFILEGDIMHKDTGGHESVITAGGVQWMTAGRGLIHAEVSSADFKKKGGPLEILQLWLNLPARLKMTEPFYLGLQQEEIPVAELNGQVRVQAISGSWNGTEGAFKTQSGISLGTVWMEEGGKLELQVPQEENIFFYVVRGKVRVNGTEVKLMHLVEFSNDAAELQVEALQKAVIILGHARPFNEPVVAQGPFVMNTEAEIIQAYQDYRAGKFGEWK